MEKDECQYCGDLVSIKSVKVIDCAPKWADVLPILINAISHGTNSSAAVKELTKMAEIADAYNEVSKELINTTDQAMESIDTLMRLIESPGKSFEPQNRKILQSIRDIVKSYRDDKKGETPTNSN